MSGDFNIDFSTEKSKPVINFFLTKYGTTKTEFFNSYLCNQLGNALFCVTSGIFAGRAQRDPAKSHELHKIAFPNVLHTRFFLILIKKISSNVKRSNEFY
jgi:hypothetical protein